ncbi:MAG: DUF58 domain-containing protein [Sedimentisphaerales bacterium]|jgi:uncharacterized protein (DUF58 family)|nr:DUF58 domain-containing protein [Sedimentisphaerales bacterium]HNY77494.1 DUF58 domain-containing protein [Sedimentisphaerales bacterium]HOC62898.1 DUF58 domain-containing protein [Sedimentisphaerales bacterium]HOH63616.1 DUF58 domain-containing protein [Sedimentisphaerales bacterium]HPY50065.1 DUF58 domain-containing protein [Sedimentisphaerales bacterium]
MPGTRSTTRKLTELLDARFMARLDSLDVLSRKILQGKMQGERRSKKRGQSVEFADHRPYVAGDDLRFVDWNVYGRLDQLFLKLFLAEQDLTVHLLTDVSMSMSVGDPSKAQFVKRLSAALGYVSLVNNNRVTISLFADGVRVRLANMRGRAYLPQMAEMLLTADCGGSSDFEKACRDAESRRIGSGITIVLSDFLFKQGYEAALRRLIGARYDLYVIQVLSPQEIEPKLVGDLKLLDIEDADVAEITVSSALLKYYRRNLAAYCAELNEFCTRRGAVYVRANSADSVESLVLNYLRRVRLLA